MTLKGTQTHKNLNDAFAGESQANRRYLYFARVARQAGLDDVAELFEETANGETGHAFGHLEYLVAGEAGDPATGEPIGDTEANLASAVAGETYEFTEMYPPMVEQAKAEGHKAKTMLGFANAAEQVHARLFAQALEAMRSGGDLSQMDVYLCPVCGDIEFGALPDKCPVCGAPAAKYQKVA